MIRSRRQAHRAAFLGVGCILVAVWTVGLTLRQDVPPIDSSLEDLAYLSGFVNDGPDLSMAAADERFAASFRNDADGAYLLIRPLTPILKPDMLVYWVPSSKTFTDGNLSEHAILTGNLAGDSPRRLSLPPGAAQGEGDIVIYSLGHRDIVARFPVRSAASPTGNSR